MFISGSKKLHDPVIIPDEPEFTGIEIKLIVSVSSLRFISDGIAAGYPP
jgi:hypothetical protein